jgi:hypothetical protein
MMTPAGRLFSSRLSANPTGPNPRSRSFPNVLWHSSGDLSPNVTIGVRAWPASYANWYANQLDSGGVRECSPPFMNRVDLQKPDTHTRVRTRCLNLGVKWSQVQILSARPEFSQSHIGVLPRSEIRYPPWVCSATGTATRPRFSPNRRSIPDARSIVRRRRGRCDCDLGSVSDGRRSCRRPDRGRRGSPHRIVSEMEVVHEAAEVDRVSVGMGTDNSETARNVEHRHLDRSRPSFPKALTGKPASV